MTEARKDRIDPQIEAMTFDELARSFGQEAVAADDPCLAHNWAGLLAAWFRDDIAKGRKGDLPMRLEFGFINDATFNAFAATHQGTDYIGINVGVWIIALDLARTVMSYPTILPEVGDPALCVPRVYADLTNIEDVATEAPAEPLACPEREKWAQQIGKAVFLHTAAHEFRHVWNGHADYLTERFGLRRLQEVDPEGAQGLTRQTLEYDADMSATQALLQHVLQPKIETIEGRAKWTLEGQGSFGDLRLSLAVVAIAVSLFDLCVSQVVDPDAPSVQRASHPPAIVRVFFNLFQIANVLWFRSGKDRREISEPLAKQFKMMSEALRSAFPGVRWWSIDIEGDATELVKRAFFEVTLPAFQRRYDAEWKQLHPFLDGLKRGGILAAPGGHEHPLA